MKNVFFKPWVGKNYESGGIFGRRILVLGEAHICGGCGGERWRPGNELVIDNYAVKNGYYRLADGKEARVLWVYHPSAGYSWDWWNKVISTGL